MKGHRKLSRQEIVSPVGIPVTFFSEGRGRIVVVCTKGLFRYDLNRNLILQPFKSDAILPASIDIISAYETYCNAHPEFPNNRTRAAEKFITETYDECLRENKFL